MRARPPRPTPETAKVTERLTIGAVFVIPLADRRYGAARASSAARVRMRATSARASRWSPQLNKSPTRRPRRWSSRRCGPWIETIDREDICTHVDELAHLAGFRESHDFAGEWREW